MFDKVIFFKLGKFYEMFYMDAIICKKVFDLGWTNEPRKLHVGFPEKSLEKNIEILIGLGYKVAVVEQTETMKMSEQRNSTTGVSREIQGCYSKGTVGIESWVICVRKQGDLLGICYFDIAS